MLTKSKTFLFPNSSFTFTVKVFSNGAAGNSTRSEYSPLSLTVVDPDPYGEVTVMIDPGFPVPQNSS